MRTVHTIHDADRPAPEGAGRIKRKIWAADQQLFHSPMTISRSPTSTWPLSSGRIREHRGTPVGDDRKQVAHVHLATVIDVGRTIGRLAFDSGDDHGIRTGFNHGTVAGVVGDESDAELSLGKSGNVIKGELLDEPAATDFGSGRPDLLEQCPSSTIVGNLNSLRVLEGNGE